QGTILAASVLTKQSNAMLLALMPAVAIIWPPELAGATLVQRVALTLAGACRAIASLCNPVGLVEEMRSSTDPVMRFDVTPRRAMRQLLHPLRPREHYHFGSIRHKRTPRAHARAGG